MMKQEFEKMTIRGGAAISSWLYDAIEGYYMSDNNYHRENGGIEESKQDFVKRVFGGKVNTPKTILKKIIKESQKENRFCLRGHNIDKKRLDNMDDRLTEYYTCLAKME